MDSSRKIASIRSGIWN